MILIEKTEIFGWEAAIRGMRNSFNSWDKSDSKYNPETGKYEVGPADVELMDRLSRSGPSHAKFLRYITVQFDYLACFFVVVVFAVAKIHIYPGLLPAILCIWNQPVL